MACCSVFFGALPCRSQRISVGKKGHVKVLRTDSTSAREFVRNQEDGTKATARVRQKYTDAVSDCLDSDVDLQIPTTKTVREKTFAVIIANS